MRIIAGEFGGRSITPPSDRRTRPMLDRVREALFSTLGDRVEDAAVLDLFAGTGSLGLEALSRGARFVRFVERGRDPRERLAANVQALRVGERSEIAGSDALRPVSWRPVADPSRVEALDAPTRWADLIFMDPPYPFWKERGPRARLLAAIEELAGTILTPSGILMLHTAPRDLDPPDLPGAPEPRRYGRSLLWYVEALATDPPG